MPIAPALLDQITSNDSTLTSLDLSYQNLDDADLVILIDALKVNTTIASIDVSGVVISDEGIKTLASPDCKFTSLIAHDCKIKDVSDLLKLNRLVSLGLAGNEISPECIALISENKVLTELSLAGNALKDEPVIVLAKTTSIVSLILSHNKITHIGAAALAKNSSIVHLNLNHNHLDSEGVIALADNSTIRELFVGGNRISTPGMQSLAANKTYTTLDVSYNKIGNASAVLLLLHPTIVNLNLAYNEISFEGVNELPEGTPLEHLNISYNFLKDTGIIVIAKHKSIRHLDASGNRVQFEGTFALAMNKTLQTLVYSSNGAGDPGAVILAQNTYLKELIMSYNGIKDAGALALAANTTLKKLNLNYNMIGDKGKDALRKNETRELILSPEQPPEFTDENLDKIFMLSESFLCICDLKGTLQFFNPSFSRALGRTQDELLGHSFYRYLHPADRKTLEQQLTPDDEIIFYNHDNRYVCKDGSVRNISWTSNIIHSRMYAVGTDITEKRRIEKELLRIEQVALLHRVVEAETFNKRQKEFISHLSHEIRNPLTSIIGLIDSLQEQFKKIEEATLSLRRVTSLIMQSELANSLAEIADDLKQINAFAQYGESILIDSILLVSIAEKKLTLKNKPFELKEWLLEIISMFHDMSRKKGLRLEHELPALEKIWIKGDYLRLKQIVVNLLGNAVKFTKAGGIKVKCTLSNQTATHLQVEINIVDTGMGLDLAEQKELFRQYSQPGTGATYGGSGIGLYLSRELAHLMGGEISVNSEKAKGSDFCVSMVFEKVSFLEIQKNEEASNLPKPTELKPSPLLILVVEDNSTNQRLLCRILEKANFICTVANNGQEAVDAFIAAWKKGFFYNAILMDIMMPIMDGLTATALIRGIEKDNKLPQTPIIAVTANAQESDKKKGVEAGVNHYFTKPYKAKDIVMTISNLSNQQREIKLTTSQLLTRVDSAAPDLSVPTLPVPLSLSPRSNSSPLVSTTELDNAILQSSVNRSAASQHTGRLFRPHLTSHTEGVPLAESPADSKRTLPSLSLTPQSSDGND